MNHLREQLRQRRQARGLSMYAVIKAARRLAPGVKGLHSTALLEWERGDSGRHPSDEQLIAWAAALDMKVELREAA